MVVTTRAAHFQPPHHGHRGRLALRLGPVLERGRSVLAWSGASAELTLLASSVTVPTWMLQLTGPYNGVDVGSMLDTGMERSRL